MEMILFDLSNMIYLILAFAFSNAVHFYENVNANIVTLESFNVNVEMVSISGLSSGAAFVNNFMVVHSNFIKGAGTFAGLPYGCEPPNGERCDNVTAMVEHAQNREVDGLIDPLENLQGKPISLFHGKDDNVTAPAFSHRSAEFYEAFGANIITNFTSICGHGTPSLDQGIECSETEIPMVNHCAWSGAYYAMEHIYGGLLHPEPNMVLEGQWVEFDQTEFTEDFPRHSFADSGFAYYPTGCLDRTKECKLHVSFHGCFLLSSVIGDDYARNSGHNEVGELNDVIVLHPQLAATVTNPVGCWAGGSEPDTKNGVEIRVVMKMIDRVLGHTN